MTLAIAAITTKGIILGADSRMSVYENGGERIEYKDDATKIVQLSECSGAVATGDIAWLDSSKNRLSSSINVLELLRKFRSTNPADKSFHSLVQELSQFLKEKYDAELQLEKLKAHFTKKLDKLREDSLEITNI